MLRSIGSMGPGAIAPEKLSILPSSSAARRSFPWCRMRIRGFASPDFSGFALIGVWCLKKVMLGVLRWETAGAGSLLLTRSPSVPNVCPGDRRSMNFHRRNRPVQWSCTRGADQYTRKHVLFQNESLVITWDYRNMGFAERREGIYFGYPKRIPAGGFNLPARQTARAFPAGV